MSNFFKIILIFILLASCSFNKNSKFWNKTQIIKEKPPVVDEIFKKEEALNLEFNSNLKISLYSKSLKKSFLNNYDNNNGRINYDGNLKNISKFNFSRIKNFYQYDPKISFSNNDIIFFDNKGTILKFDDNSNLIWEKNYYSKSQKKQNPILFFANNKNILIIADNISKYYAIDINNGKLLWTKNHTSPFNSQIKIYQDKFFVIDFENTLRSYSLKDGTEIWNIKTENSLIRSQKKLSMVIVDKKIYFNNSLGDISSVDINSGQLIWQTPTRNSLILEEDFFLKTSDIIADKNTLFFSNNKNQFFSIDIKTGIVNWEQAVNSNLRPTLIDDYIFTVSLEGYLIVIDKKSGNIIRVTDVFKNYAKRKKIKNCKFKEFWNCTGSPFTKKIDKSLIIPTGFIVGKDNIFVATDIGKLIVIETQSGNTQSVLSIGKNKITRPAVLNQNMYIISNNSIIKLN